MVATLKYKTIKHGSSADQRDCAAKSDVTSAMRSRFAQSVRGVRERQALGRELQELIDAGVTVPAAELNRIADLLTSEPDRESRDEAQMPMPRSFVHIEPGLNWATEEVDPEVAEIFRRSTHVHCTYTNDEDIMSAPPTHILYPEDLGIPPQHQCRGYGPLGDYDQTVDPVDPPVLAGFLLRTQ